MEEYTIEKCLERERKRSSSGRKSNATSVKEVNKSVNQSNRNATSVSPFVNQVLPLKNTRSPTIDLSSVNHNVESWRERALEFQAEEERLTQERQKQAAEEEVDMPPPINTTLKHKRVSKLKNFVTPVNSPTTTAGTSLGIPLTTPQRQVLKRILEDPGETPRTKRMKELMKTPRTAGSSNVPIPQTPSFLKTPTEEFWPDDTLNSRLAYKRKVKTTDKRYCAPVESTDKVETPPHEFNKRWWKIMNSDKDMTIDSESQSQHPLTSTPTTSKVQQVVHVFTPN